MQDLWLFSHFVTMERTSDIVSYGRLIHEISYREKKETMNIMRIEHYQNTLEHRNVRGEMEMINSLIYSIAWDWKDNAAYGIGRSHTLSELEMLEGFRFCWLKQHAAESCDKLFAWAFGGSFLYTFSLALDIAEVFKPFLVDRVICWWTCFVIMILWAIWMHVCWMRRVAVYWGMGEDGIVSETDQAGVL